MTTLTHTNLLTPLAKPTLGMEVQFLGGDVILNTNIDGIPYALSAPQHPEEKLHQNDKVSFEGTNEVYTVKKISYNKNILEAKLDKVLQLEEREITNLVVKHNSWNEPDVADKLEPNYTLNGVNFVIEGKLSKNQTVRFCDILLKITDLVKREDGLTEIKGESIKFKTLSDIYPYKVDNNIQAWYYDIKDCHLRAARDHVNKKELELMKE